MQAGSRSPKDCLDPALFWGLNKGLLCKSPVIQSLAAALVVLFYTLPVIPKRLGGGGEPAFFWLPPTSERTHLPLGLGSAPSMGAGAMFASQSVKGGTEPWFRL